MKSLSRFVCLVLVSILILVCFVSVNVPLASTAARSGAQNFAVICAHFSDVTTTRWTANEIQTIMTTINDFYYNASYKTMTIASQVEGWYDLGNTQASYGNLEVGNNWHDVILDAVDLADPDIDFSQFSYVVVWINIPWRGVSSIGNWFSITTDEGTFNVGASLVGEHAPTGQLDTEAAVWGRVAHEMGHAFGLYHTHPNYNSNFSLMARGYPSDLIVYSQIIDSVTGWFKTGSNQKIISPGEPQTDFVVRPRSLDILGDYQSLRVEISSSMYYMVEVVKNQSEDGWSIDEGVLIYSVDAGLTDQACLDKPGPTAVLWKSGEKFTDALNSISIEVLDRLGDGYQIRVNNDAGSPDLMITPWGAPPYETPDIWVDSPVNGWGFYRHRNIQGDPEGNGDEPWANHENRLYARVHNVGQVNAHATIKFYFTSPIGAGNTVWDYIGKIEVDVTKGDQEEVYVPWTPVVTVNSDESGILPMHGCVKVEITPLAEETTSSNNNAQENISFFEILQGEGGASGGGFEALDYTFRIWNPFATEEELYVNIIDQTPNWRIANNSGIAVFSTFKSSDKRDFYIRLVPNEKIGFGEDLEAHIIMGYTEMLIVDNFIGDLVMKPVGGLSINARTMYRSLINMSATVNTSVINVAGILVPLNNMPSALFPAKGGDRSILLEINETRTGKLTSALVETDDTGNFNHQFTGLTNGVYTVVAYYEGTNALASTSSETSASVTASDVSGWTLNKDTLLQLLLIAIVILVLIGAVLLVRKRKKP